MPDFNLGRGVRAPQPIFNMNVGQDMPDGSGSPVYDPVAIENRADRIAYALDDNPTRDQIAQNLRTGNDDLLRQMAQTREEQTQWTEQVDQVNEMTRDPLEAALPESQGILGLPPNVNRNVSIETAYARNFVNDIFFEDGEIPDFQQLSAPEQRNYNIIVQALESNVVRDEVIRAKYDQYSRQWADQAGLTNAWDVVETMIPGKDWLTFSAQLDLIPGYNLRLPGDSVRAQIEYLHRLPPAEFAEQFATAVDEIARTNLSQAFFFIQAVQSFTRSDQALQNIFTLIDIATLPGTGMLFRTFRGGLQAARAARRPVTMTGVGAGTFGTETTARFNIGGTEIPIRSALLDTNEQIEEIIRNVRNAQVGNTFNATPPTYRFGATDDVTAGMEVLRLNQEVHVEGIRVTPGADAQRLARNLPGYMNPSQVATGNRSTVTPRDLIARLQTVFQKIDPGGNPILNSTYGISRMTPEEYDAAARATITKAVDEFGRHGNNAIYSIERIHAEDITLNTDHLAFRLRKPAGTFFPKEATATWWAENIFNLRAGDFRIVPEKKGFGIEVTRSVDETQSARDVDIVTNNQTHAPFFGFLRSANDIFGYTLNEARKKVIHLQQLNNQVFAELRNTLNIGGKQGKQFNEFLEYLQNTGNFPGVDPATVSRTLTAQADFEAAWHKMYGSLPTAKQSNAYWHYVKLYDQEWATKNLAIWRSLQRSGIEEIRLTQKAKGSGPVFQGQVMDHAWTFDGLADNTTFLRYDQKGAPFTMRLEDLTPAMRQAYLAEVQNGTLWMIRVHNRGDLPFKALNETDVDFVITADAARGNISDVQIPFTPGGYIINNSPYQIRQVRTGHVGRWHKKVNWGETIVTTAPSNKIASETAAHVNNALDLYKTGKASGNHTGLINYLNQHLDWIDPVKFIDDLDTGKLMPDMKVVVTKRGQSVVTAKEKNLIQSQLQGTEDYASQLNVGAPIGSTERPLYELHVPENLSPKAAIDRAMSSTIKLGAVADYVIKSAEHFIREFESVLTPSRAQLRKDPVKYLINAPLYLKQSGTLLAQQESLRRAKLFWRSTRDLLGHQGEFRQSLGRLEDKIFESIYSHGMGQLEIGGKSLAKHASDLFVWTLDEPPAILRAMAFKMTLGMFNPYQLWKQAQTMFVSAAITGSPMVAMKGMGAAWLMAPLATVSKTGKMINHMAGMATKLGWKKADFEELWNLADRSGYTIIRGEHALKDKWLDPSLVTSKIGEKARRVINWGDTPFKAGEGYSRLTGLAIAYQEWRRANPTKAFRRVDENSVMRRADDLTVNMTHASNAAWQKGYTAFPTQFFSYQIRLGELFWGKRLTRPEKFRLLFAQALMYGLPIGAGVATVVLPLHDTVVTNLRENGVNMDSAATQAMIGGIYGLLGYWLAGDNPTNAAQEFGAGGVDVFMEMLTGDATFRELMFGVTGSKLTEIIDSSYPFIVAFKRMLGLAPRDGSISPTWEDYAQVLRSISSFTNIERAVYAMNTAAYLRKDGTEAFINLNHAQTNLLAIFGIDPQEVNDEFLMNISQQDWTQFQARPREELTQAYQDLYEIASNTTISVSEMQRQMTNVERRIQAWVVMGGFTPEQKMDIFTEAVRVGGPSFLRAYESFSLNSNMPNSDRRFNAFVQDEETRTEQTNVPETPGAPEELMNALRNLQ